MPVGTLPILPVSETFFKRADVKFVSGAGGVICKRKKLQALAVWDLNLPLRNLPQRNRSLSHAQDSRRSGVPMKESLTADRPNLAVTKKSC